MQDAPFTKQKLPPPGKKWKNRWRIIVPTSGNVRCVICQARIPLTLGIIYENHCLIYPSKDLAETDAQDPAFVHPKAQYLGAFRID